LVQRAQKPLVACADPGPSGSIKGLNCEQGVLAGVGFALSPAAGAVLMSLSTIVVALNAQLLRRIRLDPEELARS
jgi:hypothetical protein